MDTLINGKEILISGGTDGIGLATARGLARMGGRVTLIGRNPEKCASIADSISNETGAPVGWISADLSTLDGIRGAAEQYLQGHSRLHVLINNAGGFFLRRELTPDGFERTFALNHLNYFLLSNLLLDLLKSSNPTRIVNVSSAAHTGLESLDFDNLQGERSFSGWKAYSMSKLANLLFTYELARRLQGSGVTVNALHPGYVNTGLGGDNGLPVRIGARISAVLFGRRPDDGARTSLYLASSPEVASISGKYFIDCEPAESSPVSRDEAAAARLWELSLKMAGLDK